MKFLLAALILGMRLVEAAAPSRPPLLFIHGIKGARLANANCQIEWVTPWQVLGLKTSRLELPLNFDRGYQDRDALSATGILEKITIVPFVLEESIYGPWISANRRETPRFYPFAYDWRRDNNETVSLFETFIDKIRKETGSAKVDVVSHSMGGLITLVAANRRPEIFRRIVFAGVPFSGGIGFLPDLHQGTRTGLNAEILSPKVLASFPSVYSLFGANSNALFDSEGKKLPLNFLRADDWKRYALGPFEINRKRTEEFERFFSAALSRVSRFHELANQFPTNFPQSLTLCGDKEPTLSAVQQKGLASPPIWNFEKMPKSPGDGRIAFSDCQPPAALQSSVFQVDSDHTHLLNDVRAIQEIARFLDKVP